MPAEKQNQLLKVAVAGVGDFGAIHAKIYAAMPDVELVAVVDADAARAAEIAARHNCEALQSPEQLAGKVDAASVAVPTSFHLPVARALLEKGIHVMLEKPIAPSIEESRAIVAMAARNGVILQIGHLERFNAGVMKLAELASAPRFIEVHRLGAFVERATDVDVVADLMIHDIDIALSLVPSDLAEVRAAGARVITEHVDIANARLEFANGAVANVTASRVSRRRFRRIRVFSQDAYLALDFTDQRLEHIAPGELNNAPKSSGEKFPPLVARPVEVAPQLPLNAELAHFADCVRHRRRPLVSGEDGLLAVQVAQEVRRNIAESIARGGRAGAPGRIAEADIFTSWEGAT
ncbi:MAG: Gfo/Idh/MocA family oxidoreductase [Gammaproteobacteria bacterium]|nr:Gfo/Idh/MocA family oxidoreductase [Gammaproteobacteria bacterium]